MLRIQLHGLLLVTSKFTVAGFTVAHHGIHALTCGTLAWDNVFVYLSNGFVQSWHVVYHNSLDALVGRKGTTSVAHTLPKTSHEHNLCGAWQRGLLCANWDAQCPSNPCCGKTMFLVLWSCLALLCQADVEHDFMGRWALVDEDHCCRQALQKQTTLFVRHRLKVTWWQHGQFPLSVHCRSNWGGNNANRNLKCWTFASLVLVSLVVGTHCVRDRDDGLHVKMKQSSGGHAHC